MAFPPILLVDDDANQLSLFCLLLRHLPYPLLTAQTVEQAERILVEHIPALIMLDVAMPGQNGLTLLDTVRAAERLKDTRIIILTAVPSRVSKEAAAAADQVIAKPFMIDNLQRVVTEALSARK